MRVRQMRIEDILSRPAIEAVQRPTAQATGLPSIAYTSPEFLKLEQDLLFAPGWVYAGRAAEPDKAGEWPAGKMRGKAADPSAQSRRRDQGLPQRLQPPQRPAGARALWRTA